MENQKVLITGGAGYIGSVLSKRLLELGYKVTCLDKLIYKQTSPLDLLDHPNFEFVWGDVRDRALLERLVPGKDIIIPLAALVGMPLCEQNPRESEEINYGAVKLINELRTNDQKMIFPNTNSGYGIHSDDSHCTEDTPLNPISVYGKTKCDAEKHLLESPKDAVTFRLATVFGASPRMRTDLIVGDFVLTALKKRNLVLFEKNFRRNFIHIKDVVRAFIHAIENFEEMKNKPYNLGLDDANLTKLELAEKIKTFLPKTEILEAEIGEDPDKRDYLVSNKRLLDTGFRPKYSLDYGIQELLKVYEVLLRIENKEYRNF